MSKRIFTCVAMVAMLFVMAVAAQAQQTIYLKGTGTDFNKSGWQNVFEMTDDCGQYPRVWHLVYTGDKINEITYMQISFNNGDYVFEWEPRMGFSRNAGGNNPGWIIVAPYGWAIDYVNSGNNNRSDSFLVTNESGNINFNISGYNAGKPDDPPIPSFGTITVEGTFSQDTITETTTEYWTKIETYWEKWVQYYSQFDSTTLTNAGYSVEFTSNNKVIGNTVVVPNSNHFAYATLSKQALAAGPIELALVNGSRVNQVGSAVVSMNQDGTLEIEFDDVLEGLGYKFGAIAFDGFLPAPKNGNIHSCDFFSANNSTMVTVLQKTSFQSTDKKGAFYDKDWADLVKGSIGTSGNIYLYMHANPIHFDEGAEMVDSGTDIDWEFDGEETVTSTATSKGALEITIYGADGNVVGFTDAEGPYTLEDLKAGTYSVVYFCPNCDETFTDELVIAEGQDEVSAWDCYCADAYEYETIEDVTEIKNEDVITWTNKKVN